MSILVYFFSLKVYNILSKGVVLYCVLLVRDELL
nr:MAG TPA: hypothetical protein [Caudoviricetes sp.]